MDSFALKIVEACLLILQAVTLEQQNLLSMAEDQEKVELREIVYDLQQAGSLLNRAINR